MNLAWRDLVQDKTRLALSAVGVALRSRPPSIISRVVCDQERRSVPPAIPITASGGRRRVT